MNDDAHDQAHDDVQQGDQQTRDRVALDEFRRTIERAEKCRFLLLQLAARLGFFMVDSAGGHIGIDGKLLAGHPVERKSRPDLGHAGRALCDDHEIHDQQNAKDNETQKDTAAHDKAGEPFDHVTSRARTGMALPDDQFRRGNIQRQSQHQGGKQHRRKRREIQRASDKERYGKD